MKKCSPGKLTAGSPEIFHPEMKSGNPHLPKLYFGKLPGVSSSVCTFETTILPGFSSRKADRSCPSTSKKKRYFQLPKKNATTSYVFQPSIQSHMLGIPSIAFTKIHTTIPVITWPTSGFFHRPDRPQNPYISWAPKKQFLPGG